MKTVNDDIKVFQEIFNFVVPLQLCEIKCVQRFLIFDKTHCFGF